MNLKSQFFLTSRTKGRGEVNILGRIHKSFKTPKNNQLFLVNRTGGSMLFYNINETLMSLFLLYHYLFITLSSFNSLIYLFHTIY